MRTTQNFMEFMGSDYFVPNPSDISDLSTFASPSDPILRIFKAQAIPDIFLVKDVELRLRLLCALASYSLHHITKHRPFETSAARVYGVIVGNWQFYSDTIQSIKESLWYKNYLDELKKYCEKYTRSNPVSTGENFLIHVELNFGLVFMDHREIDKLPAKLKGYGCGFVLSSEIIPDENVQQIFDSMATTRSVQNMRMSRYPATELPTVGFYCAP